MSLGRGSRAGRLYHRLKSHPGKRVIHEHAKTCAVAYEEYVMARTEYEVILRRRGPRKTHRV